MIAERGSESDTRSLCNKAAACSALVPAGDGHAAASPQQQDREATDAAHKLPALVAQHVPAQDL